MGQLEHGEFAARVNDEDQVFDVQQGQVTGVSPSSVSVKSLDGFTATYVVDGSTKVRKDRANATTGDAYTGDQAHALAGKSGDTLTAQRIFRPRDRAEVIEVTTGLGAYDYGYADGYNRGFDFRIVTDRSGKL